MSFGLIINGEVYQTERLPKKGLIRVSDLPGTPDMITVHRVVDEGHPTYHEACCGTVRPWGEIREPTLERVMMMTEGTRPNTGLTCWSTNREYAMGLAGPGDVILIHRVKATEAYLPPNARPRESEVLIHGVIKKAAVLRR